MFIKSGFDAFNIFESFAKEDEATPKQSLKVNLIQREVLNTEVAFEYWQD